MEPLDLLDDSSVDGVPAISQKTAVGHLLRQRVLERVLRLRKEARLVEKFRGLQVRELSAEIRLVPVGDGVKQVERDVLSDDSRRLQQLLLHEREPIDPRGQDCLNRGRHLNRIDGLDETIRPTLTHQGLGLHKSPHALFKKERVTLRPLDEELPQRGQLGAGAQKRPQEILGPFAWQRIDAQLRVVAPVSPGVLVLGAIGNEEQETSGEKRVNEAIQPRLGLRVDPVQVLENEQQRLDLTLAKDQAPGDVERVLPALTRVQSVPLRALDRHTEQGRER